MIGVDAHHEIIHIAVDGAEPVRDTRRNDDDVAGSDVATLAAANARAVGARAHENFHRRAVGRRRRRVGHVSAGDEHSRAVDDVVNLGDLRVGDRRLPRVGRAMENSDGDVVLADIDDAYLLIHDAVGGCLFERGEQVRARDVDCRRWWRCGL